jgi:hypothetical protein
MSLILLEKTKQSLLRHKRNTPTELCVFNTNPIHKELFSFNTQLDLGEFFNGNRYSFENRFTLRIQPKVNLGFNTNFDHIALPGDYGMANILLLSPRIQYTFNRNLFWSTLFNTVINVTI